MIGCRPEYWRAQQTGIISEKSMAQRFRRVNLVASGLFENSYLAILDIFSQFGRVPVKKDAFKM